MSRVAVYAAVLAMVAVVTSQMYPVCADDKKLTIKEIMEKAHKGKESPVQTVLAGKADEKLLKQFLEYYEFMATQKPPVGDAASWKTKTTALVDATKGVIEKKANSMEALKTAVDCKACHTAHKPKKPQ